MDDAPSGAELPGNANCRVEAILRLGDARRIVSHAQPNTRRWDVVSACPVDEAVPQAQRLVLVRTGVADTCQQYRLQAAHDRAPERHPTFLRSVSGIDHTEVNDRLRWRSTEARDDTAPAETRFELVKSYHFF